MKDVLTTMQSVMKRSTKGSNTMKDRNWKKRDQNSVSRHVIFPYKLSIETNNILLINVIGAAATKLAIA